MAPISKIKKKDLKNLGNEKKRSKSVELEDTPKLDFVLFEE